MEKTNIEEVMKMVKKLHESTEILYNTTKYIYQGALANHEESSIAIKGIEEMADKVNIQVNMLENYLTGEQKNTI